MSQTKGELEPNDFLYEKDDSIFGKPYRQWTEDWWNWLVSIPKKDNPANDASGRHGKRGQPEKDVWFLAGEVKGKAKRKIDVPAGRAILCPVVNYEWSGFEMLGLVRNAPTLIAGGHTLSDEEKNKLAELTKDYLDDMYSLDAIIDEGEDNELKLYTGRLCNYRLNSKAFDLTFTKDNIFNTYSGMTTASADGYWLFIRENVFKKGEKHTLWFRGVTQYYSTEVAYSIRIV
jgi:hypothetical protein